MIQVYVYFNSGEIETFELNDMDEFVCFAEAMQEKRWSICISKGRAINGTFVERIKWKEIDNDPK